MGNNSGGKTMLSAGLTLATFASFAAPPPAGFLLAGIFAVVDKLLGRSSEDAGAAWAASLVRTIDDAIKSDIENQQIRTIVGNFNSYAKHLGGYMNDSSRNIAAQIAIPKDILGEIQKNPIGDFAALYTLARGVINDPGGMILSGISQLQVPDGETSDLNFQVRALPAFLMGVGLYLSYYKVYLLINAHGGVDVDRPAVVRLLNDIAGWLDYVKETAAYIEKQVMARLSQITIERGLGVVPSEMPLIFPINHLFIVDAGQRYPGIVVPSGGASEDVVSQGPDGSVYAVLDDSKNLSETLKLTQAPVKAYADSVRTQAYAYYASYNRADIADVTEKWVSMAKHLGQIANTPVPNGITALSRDTPSLALDRLDLSPAWLGIGPGPVLDGWILTR